MIEMETLQQAHKLASEVGANSRGHDDESPELHRTVSLDSINPVMGDAEHINHDMSFSLDIVCKGFPSP